MINEIEVGKKYRLIDKEGYMSSKYNGNYNRRLLATVGVFDENMCVVITAEREGCGSTAGMYSVISPNEYHLFELVDEDSMENKEPKVITPETEVTITTTYGELARAYFVMGAVTGRRATLWKTVGDLLGDSSRSIYTEFNPVTNIMTIDYEEHQEDWEALFFKSKEQQEKELVINHKLKLIEELKKEIIRLSV